MGGSNPAAVTVEIGSTEDCILELKYFRLSHTRTLKESYRFNVWQSQTFLGPTPPSSRVNGHIAVGLNGNTNQFYAMRPVGKDAIDPAAATSVAVISSSRAQPGASPALLAYLRPTPRVPVL